MLSVAGAKVQVENLETISIDVKIKSCTHTNVEICGLMLFEFRVLGFEFRVGAELVTHALTRNSKLKTKTTRATPFP